MERERITDRQLFAKSADQLAQYLLGKILCKKCNGTVKRYRILETEAYTADEKDAKGKYICYGAGKTKETAKNLKVAYLFKQPGTWCVYGGLLLISAKAEGVPDNVLIRACECYDEPYRKFEKPDKLAKELKLYKTQNKMLVEGYADYSGVDSLALDAELYFEDAPAVLPVVYKRVNINDDKKWNFKIKE